jgi:predicted hydrocarbon binding protein
MPTLQIAGAKGQSAVAEAGGTLVLHSRHYHAALLRTLFEAEGIEADVILRDAGRVATDVYHGAIEIGDGAARGLTESIRSAGLGQVTGVSLGVDGTGEIQLRASHFATAWTARYPAAASPVCAATTGILSSILSSLHGRSLTVEESACVAAGDAACTFSVSHGEVDRSQPARAGQADPAVVRQRGACEEDGGGLIDDLFGGPFRADEGGVMAGPGGPFALLPAAFYAAVAGGFEREIPRRRGPKFGNLPGILLQEAAHRNGFSLFGEILRSAAWLERVEPRLATAEERLRMLLRLVGAIGWGSWEVKSFVPGERLIVQVEDSYEAVAHGRLFGQATSPRCYVARGAAAAIMNLLFRAGNLRGSELTDSDYNRLFRSPASFRAVETRCRALGDPVCEIVANPLSL